MKIPETAFVTTIISSHYDLRDFFRSFFDFSGISSPCQVSSAVLTGPTHLKSVMMKSDGLTKCRGPVGVRAGMWYYYRLCLKGAKDINGPGARKLWKNPITKALSTCPKPAFP